SCNPTDTTGRDAGMLHSRPAPSHRWSSWLPVPAPRRPGRGRRCPPQAWPQLLGQNLHDGSSAAVLGGPAPLLELAQDHDPAALASDSPACSAWSRQTTTVKNDASCSRRPDTATRNL